MTLFTDNKPILGVLADDFTGASDLASFLLKGGMRVVQVNGLPDKDFAMAEPVDAIVIALKTRTCSVSKAISTSLNALQWLQQQGCQKFYFKYCSTFDSTAAGNIGPVTEALAHALKTDRTVFCPALPVNGRTVYQGHLFVFDQLLSDSPLKDHPLTPMRDSNLIRLLTPQLTAENTQKLALLNLFQLREAEPADQSAIQFNAELGANSDVKSDAKYWVVDCVDESDLAKIAALFAHQSDYPLLTGGSGLGEFLAQAYLSQKRLEKESTAAYSKPTKITKNAGKTLMLAGSCSKATRQQIEYANKYIPTLALDIIAIATQQFNVNDIINWIDQQSSEAVLIYTSVDPQQVLNYQAEYGKAQISQLIEKGLTEIASTARQHGILNLIVAGGETSGAIVSGLQLKTFTVGQSICPGVPVMQSHHKDNLVVALKSGNFGDETFFLTALETIK